MDKDKFGFVGETAAELIEAIQELKHLAILQGDLREEKKLPTISKDKMRNLEDGWEWCRLGDYCYKVTDYVASGSFASLKENVLITNEENYAVMVKTADFANGFTRNLTYTDEKGYNFLENSNLFGGELILSNIGSIGKVFIVPHLNRPMTLASNTVMLRMVDERLVKYLYYLFLSPYGQKCLSEISSGTSMMKFNKTQLKTVIIPIAPLKKQKEICDILDKITSSIELRNKQLEKLDTLIKARFVEMFGDPVSNSMNWNQVPLKKYLKSIRYGTSTPPAFSDRGYAFIRATNIKSGRIVNEGMKYIDEVEARKLEKCRVNGGEIIIVRSGVNAGDTCVITDQYKNQFAGYDMILELKDANSEFLNQLINTEYMERVVKPMTRRAAQPHLNAEQVQNFPIIEVPVDLQNQFATFVEQVDKSKVAKEPYRIKNNQPVIRQRNAHTIKRGVQIVSEIRRT